jgi:hypothetical protein
VDAMDFDSPIASPVARKRKDHDDDSGKEPDHCKEIMAARRSSRNRIPNIFFDPGNGEPDSHWSDRRSGASSAKLQKVLDVATAPFVAAPVVDTPVHGGMASLPTWNPADDIDEDATVVISEEEVTGIKKCRDETMAFVALANKEYVIKQLSKTIFKFLDKKSWRDRIKAHVKSAIIDIGCDDSEILNLALERKGRSNIGSWGAVRQAVSECIDSEALEKELLETIWDAFCFEHLEARAIENVMRNTMGDVNFKCDEDEDEE